MTYASIRRALCKWLSLHSFDLIEITHEHEHGKCPWCGLEAWVDNETREARFS